ncbi:acyltransferase family protein [Lactiplantibacillus plantarum]|uniref:acyltransferase family protein n=2 Tax=Lactiplantibacillus plantarum TaxID=1590 RepID=UPI0009B55C21|nr:acyltransferase family protein [Lactiplantibacillus plantarum]
MNNYEGPLRRELNMNKRIFWVDNARGFAMLLILLGHSYPPYDLKMWIYSFHVPLFFFLSGYLFKKRNIIDTIRRKNRSLLMPYFLTALISIPFGVVIYKMVGKPMIDLFYGFFYLNGSVGWNAPIWFLVVLFWVEFSFAIIVKLNLNDSSILFFTLIIGFYIYTNKIFIPFGLNIAIWNLPFYHIGYLIRKAKVLETINFNKLISELAGVFFILFTGWISVLFNSAVPEAYHEQLGSYFIYYPVALVGIVGVIGVFRYTQPISFLTEISSNSLFILCSQYFIIFGIKLVYRIVGLGDLSGAGYIESILLTIFIILCYSIFFFIKKGCSDHNR